MPRAPGRVSLHRASWAPSRGSGPLPLGTDTPECAVSAALLGMGARRAGWARSAGAGPERIEPAQAKPFLRRPGGEGAVKRAGKASAPQ